MKLHEELKVKSKKMKKKQMLSREHRNQFCSIKKQEPKQTNLIEKCNICASLITCNYYIEQYHARY